MRALLILVPCVALLESGCEKVSDVNQNYAQTKSFLSTWKDYVKACQDAGLAIDNCKDIREAVAFLERYSYIKKDTTESLFLLQDGWRREYHWSVRRDDGKSIIRICSAGKDGSDQNGENHDLA